MQLNGDYFVTDPKGTLLPETGHLFHEQGYTIKSFNTIQFDKSLHYNPLVYVKTDAELLSFVNCLIANTSGEGTKGDPFWENAERLLYVSLLAFLRDWMPPEDYSLSGLLTLLSMAEAHEDDENYKSPLDLAFEQIETGQKYVRKKGGQSAPGEWQDIKAIEARRGVPASAAAVAAEYEWVPSKFERNYDHVRPAEVKKGSGYGLSNEDDFALDNYKAFKTAAGKTLKSIIISCNVRLKPLSIKEVRSIIKDDQMELEKLGAPDRKTILFAIMDDTDSTFAFLHAIMMWQTINLLCKVALTNEDYKGGKLPRHVQFIFDEFANIGTLPDVKKTIAVIRSRNIGMTIILQSIAQLETRYDKAAQVIVDCCDSTVFLGGKSTVTNKEIAEMIGKQTINQRTWNQSRGQSASTTKNESIQGRDLIDASEIGRMERTQCIVLIAGTYPLMDAKYPLEKHPRYKFIDPSKDRFDANECAYAKPFDYFSYIQREVTGQGNKMLN